MYQLLPFMAFAFAASITPGPSNILAMSSSARYGFRAALPVVLGSCAGSAALVLLVGLGIGGWLQDRPDMQVAMRWAGTIWLSWLAWRIAFEAADVALPEASGPPGGIAAAAIQIVNPKTWVMALAVAGMFAGGDAGAGRYALLSGIFLAISLPCLGTWAALGATAVRFATSKEALRRVNFALAAILLASAWIETLGVGHSAP